MKLSVIIVNYNVKYFLEQCLCSVLKACSNITAEILVIDNHSTDGSKEYLEDRFPAVKFIWHNENTGFSKANNIALKQATGEFVLFLNPDTILAEDCIEKAIHFFSNQQNAGAVGIRMIDGSGTFLKESKRAFPSPLTSLFKLSGLTGLFPKSKIFARYYLGNLDDNRNSEVDVLAGAFMLVKKDILNQTGSFDETFFMYGEDVDLSYRIQKAGYKNYYFAESTIIHFKGESTSKESATYVYHFYNAMSLFVKKHYGSSKADIYNFLIHTGINIKKLIAGIKRYFPLKSKPSADWNKQRNILIIANEANYKKASNLINGNQSNIRIVGRVSYKQDIETALATIQQLPSLIIVHEINEIVFCEDDEYLFKDIIERIEQLPKSVSRLFHANGSISIIGSDDKDSSGNYII